MRLVLIYKDKVLLDYPVKSKTEFFQDLNKLERTIDGKAKCCLFNNTDILFWRELNSVPLVVTNPDDKKNYSFTDFLANLYKFPLDVIMLYYNFHKLPLLSKYYGF